MVLPCIEVKWFEKICFPARGYCNMECNDRPTQVWSGNYKNSICALSCAPPRFGLLLYFRRFVQCTKMWKHFNAIMEVFYCFTAAIGLPGEASDYNEDTRSTVAARMQSKVVVEWGNCAELGVRFWLLGLHWSSCEHAQLGGGHGGRPSQFFRQWRYNMPCPPTFISLGFVIYWFHTKLFHSHFAIKLGPWLWAAKNDAVDIVLLRLMKIKNSLWCFPITLLPHLTELSIVFQAGCFNLAHMKASVELCMNKLSDGAAKSELKADWERFESELWELRTPDGLADSVRVKWHGGLQGHRMVGKLIIPIHRKGNRSEASTALASLSLASLESVRQEPCKKIPRNNWTKAGWYPVRFSSWL